MRETNKQRHTVDSSCDTLPLWDLPWASTRLIQACVGQPWWDAPMDSCGKEIFLEGLSPLSSSSSLRNLLTFVQMKSCDWPSLSVSSPTSLCLSVSAADSLCSPIVMKSLESLWLPSLSVTLQTERKSKSPSSSLIWEQSRPPPLSSHF